MSDADRLAILNRQPLRFSDLKRMAQSPAHYAYAAVESSRAIMVGTAADTLILGGQVLAYPGAVRRGKEWEAWQAAQDPEALIVTRTELEAAEGVARAVERHPDAKALLQGVRRDTLYWSNQGRACRGTPDVRTARFLTDLKTSETSDPRFFPGKVRRFAYHAQLAWYRDGCERAGLPRPEECYIIAVEQKPPHVVTVYVLTEHILELGARLCRLWFEQLKLCEESGTFPGYSQSLVELDLPEFDDATDVIALEDA